MMNPIEMFFQTLSLVDSAIISTSEGEIVIETYRCDDLRIGRSIYAYLTQDGTVYENVDCGCYLRGYTICIGTYKDTGKLHRAMISPTYENSDGELTNDEFKDIICDLETVLELRKNAMVSITTWDQVEDIVYDLVQEELRCDTDNITAEGWDYIETIAPGKTLAKLKNDFAEDDLPEEVTKEIIKRVFTKVLNESGCRLRVD